jgi:hypothetical protein
MGVSTTVPAIGLTPVAAPVPDVQVPLNGPGLGRVGHPTGTTAPQPKQQAALPPTGAVQGVAELFSDGGGSDTSPITDFSGTNMTASDNLWWFDGVSPPNYSTTITLTADAGNPTPYAEYKWDIVSGADHVQFHYPGVTEEILPGGPGGSSEILESTGASTSMWDVTIQVEGSNNYLQWFPVGVAMLFVPTPRSLAPTPVKAGTTSNVEDIPWPDDGTSTWWDGYISKISYKIEDQFGRVLPRRVPVNESFWDPPTDSNGILVGYGTDQNGVIWDIPPNTNWGPDPAADPAYMGDVIAYRARIYQVPQTHLPSDPLDPEKVDHWTQEIRVGTTDLGKGVLVQRDTLQRYVDHGRHENIVSPVL